MRFASYVRPLPIQPRLPTPVLTPKDIARALSQVLENQAAIMNDIAVIKNILPWLTADTYGSIYEVALPYQKASISNEFLYVNTKLTQALSD